MILIYWLSILLFYSIYNIDMFDNIMCFYQFIDILFFVFFQIITSSVYTFTMCEAALYNVGVLVIGTLVDYYRDNIINNNKTKEFVRRIKKKLN